MKNADSIKIGQYYRSKTKDISARFLPSAVFLGRGEGSVPFLGILENEKRKQTPNKTRYFVKLWLYSIGQRLLA